MKKILKKLTRRLYEKEIKKLEGLVELKDEKIKHQEEITSNLSKLTNEMSDKIIEKDKIINRLLLDSDITEGELQKYKNHAERLESRCDEIEKQRRKSAGSAGAYATNLKKIKRAYKYALEVILNKTKITKEDRTGLSVIYEKMCADEK